MGSRGRESLIDYLLRESRCPNTQAKCPLEDRMDTGLGNKLRDNVIGKDATICRVKITPLDVQDVPYVPVRQAFSLSFLSNHIIIDSNKAE